MANQQQQQRCLHHEEIIKLENWPPRSGKPYDWTIPTNEAYKNQAEDELEKAAAAAASNPTEGASRRRPQHNFTLPFQLARSKLDYAYHKNPQVIRQELQDELLSNILHATSVASSSMGIKEQIKVDKTKHVEENRRKLPSPVTMRPSRRPWVVFTAGPMGVGKSYVLTQLYQRKLFPLDRFIKIDPDMLKSGKNSIVVPKVIRSMFSGY